MFQFLRTACKLEVIVSNEKAKFSDRLAFYNHFVIITNLCNLKARRSNQNYKEKISLAIPDWFKIDHTYFSNGIYVLLTSPTEKGFSWRL